MDGILRAQDAPSDCHGTIQANIARLIGNHLFGVGRCRVVIGAGVRPQLRTDRNFRVPDLAVTCAANLEGAKDVAEPKILIEVLSSSNQADTWDNLRNYVTLPTVVEILLVASTRPEIQLLNRDAVGMWVPNPIVFGAGQSVPFAAIGYQLPIPDVYWNTYLEARAQRA